MSMRAAPGSVDSLAAIEQQLRRMRRDLRLTDTLGPPPLPCDRIGEWSALDAIFAGALAPDQVELAWLLDPLAREVLLGVQDCDSPAGSDRVAAVCVRLDRAWCARRVQDELDVAPAIRSRRGLEELVASLQELASRRRLINLSQSVAAALRVGAIDAASAVEQLRRAK